MKWSYFDTALLVVISMHMVKAPFTKVEESFNLQAIHDILKYGIFDISQYDHIQFPGVVPRTFIAALIIAFMTKPFVMLSSLWGGSNITGEETQMLVRSVIGLTNAFSLIYLKNSLQELFDKDMQEKADKKESNINRMTSVGNWFLIFVMGSFHLMFYSSRSLPNFIITLPLTNVAIAWILKGHHRWGIFLLALVSIVFRLEVAALGVSITALSIYYKQVSILDAIKFGCMGVSLGIGLSLTIDSYFWDYTSIPEVDAFIFNVLAGNSAQWGVEPFYAYFTNYLRMLFLPPTVLFLNYLGFKLAPTNLKIASFAALGHIWILSIQPHKEWRFIVYTIPIIITLGAVGAAYLWENVKVTSGKQIMLLTLLPLSATTSIVVSLLFLFISSMNYPGGEALAQFNNYVINNNITNASVHITVPPCMTGVSLFGQIDSPLYNITYDKTEKPEELAKLWPTFDYLITHQILDQSDKENNWELIQTTGMFTHVNTSYINNLLFKKNRNIPTFIKETVIDMGAAGFVQEVIENTFTKSDVFFTYKKILEN